MLRSVSIAAILLASATAAFDQRADENAVEAAGDAFGTIIQMVETKIASG